MTLYKYLFYKFYSFSKVIGNEGSANESNAYLNITVFLELNIFSIILFIELLIDKKILSGITLLLFPALLMVFVYFKSL